MGFSLHLLVVEQGEALFCFVFPAPGLIPLYMALYLSLSLCTVYQNKDAWNMGIKTAKESKTKKNHGCCVSRAPIFTSWIECVSRVFYQVGAINISDNPTVYRPLFLIFSHCLLCRGEIKNKNSRVALPSDSSTSRVCLFC